MATLHNDSREALRPMPMMRIEDEVPETPEREGEYESLRPVADPEDPVTAESVDAAYRAGFSKPTTLSHRAVMGWTAVALLLGTMLFARGMVVLLKPEAQAPAAPLVPVAAAVPPPAVAAPPVVVPDDDVPVVPPKAAITARANKSAKPRATVQSHGTVKTKDAASHKKATVVSKKSGTVKTETAPK